MMDELSRITQELELNSPAPADQIHAIQTYFGIALPKDYQDWLMKSNGGEGPIGARSYLSLWPVEKIISRNEGYGVREFTPGLVLFGTDGGDTAYGFDTRLPSLPVIGISLSELDLRNKEIIASSFIDLLRYLANR